MNKKKMNKNKKRKVSVRCIFIIMTAIIMQVSLSAVFCIGRILMNRPVVIGKKQIVIGIVTSMTYMLILTAIIGVTIAAFFSRWILRPIYKINEVAKQVANGDFNVSLDETSVIREVSEMAISFNIMVKELANTETLRNDFVGNVSHEFKTPLAAVQGYCMLLQDENLDEQERQRYIKYILDNIERLTDLTNNTLALSRLDHQEIALEKEYYDLGEQIRRILLNYENLWGEKQLDLELNVDNMMFNGNRVLMAQVWSNLIDNAIKFSHQGGLLRIDCERKADRINVSIRDTGIGMSEDTIKHAFDRFYQGDKSHSTKGNGLGLALVKKIVSICEGDIWIESKLGEGSTFYISLKI
nr:HAMP domain-containing sensor histidine kinase [uncultured Cellulosilyticum sp.]